MVKIVFSDKKKKGIQGECRDEDRSHADEIIIYKNSSDDLHTLIHELIHHFLFKKQREGYKSRLLCKLNGDEVFIDGLAVLITDTIREHKTKLMEVKK